MFARILRTSILLIFAGAGFSTAQASGGGGHSFDIFPPKAADKSLGTNPSAPQNLAPGFFTKVAEDAVTLKWDPVSNATHYHIQVATDPNFKWLVSEKALLQETTYQVSGLTAGTHYYWRVAGLKPDNSAGFVKGNYSKSMFAK